MSEYPYRPLVAWMVENKVPDDWADDALIRVDEVCGLIEVEMFMRHPDGGTMLHGSHILTEMRTFPMLTPPPPGLLDAYERLRASLREERSAVAALKRQAHDDIIRELQETGHDHAAEWLASRKLAHPTPARKMTWFRAEVARRGPRADGGPELAQGVRVSVRARARLYGQSGTVLGDLYSVEVDSDGVVWLQGQALPMVAQQMADGEKFPSIDVRTSGVALNGEMVIAEFEITSAILEDIAAYPWRTPTEGAADVRS